MKTCFHFVVIWSFVISSSVYAEIQLENADQKSITQTLAKYSTYKDLADNFKEDEVKTFLKKEKLLNEKLPAMTMDGNKLTLNFNETKVLLSFEVDNIVVKMNDKTIKLAPTLNPAEMKTKLMMELNSPSTSFFQLLVPEANAAGVGLVVAAAVAALAYLTYGIVTESNLRADGRNGKEACNELKANPQALNQFPEFIKIYNDLSSSYMSHCAQGTPKDWYESACKTAANSKSCLRAMLEKRMVVNDSSRNKNDIKYDGPTDTFKSTGTIGK